MKPLQKIVMITGMQGSGASLLASCLQGSGIHLGSNLMTEDATRRSVSFENSDLTLIHEILLRDLGCRWDMVGALPHDWLETKAAACAREKIVDFIDREFTDSRLRAIKDYRLCRLLPLWQQILAEKGIEPHCLIMVRHPSEVAAWLHHNQGIDKPKGHLLWWSYTREALMHSQAGSHCILIYDQLQADPVHCLSSIRQQFDLKELEITSQQAHQLMAFCRPDEYHLLEGRSTENRYAVYTQIYDGIHLARSRALLTSEPEMSSPAPSESFFLPEIMEHLVSALSSYEQADINWEISRRRILLASDQGTGFLYATVCFPTGDEHHPYREEHSRKILLAPDEWQQISVELPQTDLPAHMPLRIHPLNTRGMIHISRIQLTDAASGKVLWSIQENADFTTCRVEDDALLLEHADTFTICATGKTPTIYFSLPRELPVKPLKINIWIKVSRDLKELFPLKTKMDQMLCKLKEKLSKQEDLTRQYFNELAAPDGKKEVAAPLIQNQITPEPRQMTLTVNQIRKMDQYRIGMGHLKKSFLALEKSVRWKTGDILIRLVEIIILRRKQPIVTDNLHVLFSEFDTWCDTDLDYWQKEQQFDHWIKCIDQDMKDLLASMRWRVGDGLCSFLEKLLFRKNQPMAVDHIDKVLTEMKHSLLTKRNR